MPFLKVHHYEVDELTTLAVLFEPLLISVIADMIRFTNKSVGLLNYFTVYHRKMYFFLVTRYFIV